MKGMVPIDWRAANVTPLYKKRNKGSPGNYRPVSLTSVVWQAIGKYQSRMPLWST